jgi:hypothetical protein
MEWKERTERSEVTYESGFGAKQIEIWNASNFRLGARAGPGVKVLTALGRLQLEKIIHGFKHQKQGNYCLG